MNKQIPGPIVIFGAGGFIGFNLFLDLMGTRSDVFAISHDPKKNWRLKKINIGSNRKIKCDLTKKKEIRDLIIKYKPKTIFNLAAYGAYSTQNDPELIYKTNFVSSVNILEILKNNQFSIYIQAGSQSEYGLNCTRPDEDTPYLPNSHYAVSKLASFYLLKYYASIHKLPVVHVRPYSIYGPYEEPSRLIPTLLRNCKIGTLPDFVDPHISRDFVYVADMIDALKLIAVKSGKKSYGQAFNIASGKKTTIMELAQLAKKIFKVDKQPVFGVMKNRAWDLSDWVGNPKKMHDIYGWKAKTNLAVGLKKTYNFIS